jgi:signal transduction histidine kinase/ActR/RegA family two-component response regulator
MGAEAATDEGGGAQGALQRAWCSLIEPEDSEVLAEQAALIRRSFPMTLYASLVTSVGAVWIMSLVAPLTIMLWWLASHVLVVGGVYAALQTLERAEMGPEREVSRLVACMGAMGITWGSLGFVAWWSSGSQTGVIYAIGILSTVSSGALGLGAPLLRGYILYLSCAVSGVLLGLAMAGGEVMLPAFALLAVYYALTCSHAYNLAQAARRSILLKFDNRRLLVELRAESSRALQAQEQAERASQDKSRFLAAASHDLRQPVHAIGLFLEALRRSPLSAHQTQVLGHARSALGSAGEMLGTLLDYSRLEAGVIKARSAPFAVQPLLQALEQEFGAESDGKNLFYRTRETAAAALADRALVDLVMRNLISNALRYTQRGGVLISCRMRGKRLALEVWDSGDGIAPADLDNIFQEFHQLGNPERDRRKGLGLGLAIVRRLASAMGAEVQVRSRPGRGSLFRLWLDPWLGALLPDDRQATLDENSSLAHLTVWVIDDDEAVCLAMQTLLLSWGCVCHVADSAETALMLARSLPQPLSAPDLIITDYRLRHEKTGGQVLALLRGQWGAQIPAIILTGDTSPQRLRDALATSAVLLHKPVAPRQLREMMLALAPRAQAQALQTPALAAP